MLVQERKVATPHGEVSVVRITNASGAYVELSSIGAGVLAVAVPDRHGKIENVALGYENPADYVADGPCMGKIPGRYANRIAGGKCVVDEKELKLPVNNGPNHLHGGPDGFQNRNWNVELLPNGVRFSLTSPDGEAGYPGELKATATYMWSEDNELSLALDAETDAPTIVNLTNHSYWNLDGADSGNVLEHEMKLNSDSYLPTDETLIPTGEVAAVAETPMDFREWKTLGKEIETDFPALKFGKGYDNCWVLRDATDNASVRVAAELRSGKSGRQLTVLTDQPGVQIYTGNWLAGSPKNRSGKSYEDYEGVAIEAQGFPDAPNQPGFPSQLLLPGELYLRTILFRFTAH